MDGFHSKVAALLRTHRATRQFPEIRCPQWEIHELRHIHKLRFWGVSDVLQGKYHYTKAEADDIAGFILPMIEIYPEKRATAAEMLSNPWIRNVDIDSVSETAAKQLSQRDNSLAKSSSDYASSGDDLSNESDDEGDNDESGSNSEDDE
ncbi:serine/threonine protein kinase, CMGC group [Chytriomyces hyalinus]|nr:serine/threonine protein kinase, CMGC group [Chytriomyces hyalinus]